MSDVINNGGPYIIMFLAFLLGASDIVLRILDDPAKHDEPVIEHTPPEYFVSRLAELRRRNLALQGSPHRSFRLTTPETPW